MDLKSIIMPFVKFVLKSQGIKTPFSLQMSEDKSKFATFAYYDPQNFVVAVYIKNRAVADIMRSIAHELVHHKQNESKRIKPNEPIQDVGGLIEDEANSVAGQLVKAYGKIDKSIYDT